MRRERAVRLLRAREDEIRRFQVRSLALFGSVARDEAAAGSDVDLLVEFEQPPTFDGYMELRFFLEDLLGCTVDLVTRGSVRARVLPAVERDAVRVA